MTTAITDLMGSEAPFGAATHSFEELKARLCGPEARAFTESELERVIRRDGREVLRQLLQGHLDLRTRSEPRVPVVGDDGIERPHVRARTKRKFKSVFGDVALTRKAYTKRGGARMPLDAQLNLPPQKYSLELRRMIAARVSHNSFDESVNALACATGLELGKRQVEEAARAASVDFDAFYSQTELAVPPSDTGDVLVITVDGKGIVMLPDSLRPQTRRALIRKGGSQFKTRLSKGERRCRKRMSTVAAVYTVAPYVREPHHVMAQLKPVEAGSARPVRPKAEHKRVWASLKHTAEEVIEEAFAEAHSRDPKLEKRWVVCVDAAWHQLALVQAAARRYDVTVTIVIDLIHVIEYLWEAGHVLCRRRPKGTEEWVHKRLLRVLKGEAGRVGGDIRRAVTMSQLKPGPRKQVLRAADYLAKNKEMMRYRLCLAKGLPIATGVIEGACRHLISDRMDITGARWSLDGAEAILRLRSLKATSDFDQYWQFHEAAEATRNHKNRYEGGRLPAMPTPAPPTGPAMLSVA